MPTTDELMRELQELRSELAVVRSRQPHGGTGHRGVSPKTLASIPLVLAAFWALSAQAPAPPADLEARVSALEGLIRKQPGNVTQVTAPFDVVGPDGKAILRVASGQTAAGAVVIWREAGRPGGNVTLYSAKGTEIAGMGTQLDGDGAVFASDKNGQPRAKMSGTGAVVLFDQQTKQIAGLVTTSDGRGRVGVWRNDTRLVALEADAEHGNAGLLRVMSPAGKLIASVGASTQDPNAGLINVMNPAGKPVAGLVGGATSGGAVVVTNSSGVGLAEMSVSSDGRGLVQVFGRGQRPIAVLTEATEHPGGLLQISNTSTPVANVTIGPGGAGYLQLTNASGQPTVEAGTMQSGRGTVRAGPQYKCVPIQPSTPIIGVPGWTDCIVGDR